MNKSAVLPTALFSQNPTDKIVSRELEEFISTTCRRPASVNSASKCEAHLHMPRRHAHHVWAWAHLFTNTLWVFLIFVDFRDKGERHLISKYACYTKGVDQHLDPSPLDV
ncbi:hypothetical protein TRVL_02415 [Trypanosoma vivax]|nr:hypothetical protein TRVL_02415 [Trypanosoma vivax]